MSFYQNILFKGVAANVYGAFFEAKTDGIQSVYSNTSSTEKEFLKNLKNLKK